MFAEASWADAKSGRAYYGVTAQESGRTGLPSFAPGGGPLSIGVGALGLVQVRLHWAAIWSVEARQLRGDAARSPLTERRANYCANVGLAYRF